jgi:membrane-bound lytic murein transglycosylase MltF
VVVANRQVQGLHTLEDLSGREIFVRPSSSYWGALEKLNHRFHDKGLPPVKIRKADESLETEDILEMVNAGAVPLTVADSQVALLWESVFDNLTVYEDLAIRTGGKIAWAVRKNNPELKASLNAFLKTHRKGTLLGNIYLRRYFENNKWIRNPFKKKVMERRERYRSLIKKYADMYAFDWLLILAQAYQESRLKHHTVSPFGAQGIMQVRPSTASDHNVDIREINQLENNIHAGVKYLAFLRDRYFSDEDVEEKDGIRFALAAYNAGPRNILRTRNRAEALGLDRNKWFRNVEIAALQQIGQEPVQYVSNINKYYLLFKFNEKNEKRKRTIKEMSPPAAPGTEMREVEPEEMAMR